MVLPVCVVLCVSWSCGCGSHWNGCMNVTCCVLWGGSRSMKPCVFPCKVAAAGDERYLVCGAVAAAVVWFLLCFATMVVPVCVVLCVSWSCGCRSHWNGCMNVAWAMFWGGSRSTKPCVFRVKWLQPAMKGTSCVRRLRLRSFGSFYVFCNNGASCVCSSMRFLKLWLQIALEWLHECCMGYVLGRKPEHETLCFSV